MIKDSPFIPSILLVTHICFRIMFTNGAEKFEREVTTIFSRFSDHVDVILSWEEIIISKTSIK